MRRLVMLAAVVSSLVAGTAQAQVPRATDTTFRPGAIGPTETALYDAVQTRPRDPTARVALGRYLVARGATRVGMTLLEEAIKFGADAAAVEPDLARAYLETGEYRSLAALKSVSAERERAQWLVAHESRTVASDSILTVPYRAPADSASVGRVSLRVDGRVLEATISARVWGIVIADTTTVARQLHRFAGDSTRASILAAADSIGFGSMSVTNVPVTIARVDGPRAAIVGLDLIGQYDPTFDPASGQITLRVGIPRVVLPNGMRFNTWSTESDVQLLQASGWISVTRPSIARVLRERRWTFDSRRGVLVVER
jgi:hypothetical protein